MWTARLGASSYPSKNKINHDKRLGGDKMKIGDLVKHPRQDYGIGIVVRVYSFHKPHDRTQAFFSKWGTCTFETQDLEVIKCK
tara:strand:- start:121 stop:369 length:249 start_codon:yes stop_codon:yes gene_type:complete